MTGYLLQWRPKRGAETGDGDDVDLSMPQTKQDDERLDVYRPTAAAYEVEPRSRSTHHTQAMYILMSTLTTSRVMKTLYMMSTLTSNCRKAVT